MKLSSSAGRPWYKEPWPWILMAGPGIVVVAGVITLSLAVTSNDGLVSDDYYKQGLAVNQRLQRDHHANDLGLQAQVMRSEQNVRLLLNANGASLVPPTELVLKLMHPTRAGQDHLIKLVQEQAGFYTGRMDSELGGRWHVSIEDPSGVWRLQGDWQVDEMEPLHLGVSK